jgi:DNA topoisomerase-3
MVDALVYEVQKTETTPIFRMWKYSKQEVKVEKKKVTGITTKFGQCKGLIRVGQAGFIVVSEPIHDYSKGSTVNLKDFKTDLGTVDGLLRFDENFKLKLEPKKIAAPTHQRETKPRRIHTLS